VVAAIHNRFVHYHEAILHKATLHNTAAVVIAKVTILNSETVAAVAVAAATTANFLQIGQAHCKSRGNVERSKNAPEEERKV